MTIVEPYGHGGLEPFNHDVLDFPTAWAIQGRGGIEHHERCSSVEGWHPLSGPGILCDCGAVEREYARLKTADPEGT